jgi:Zn-dependent protease with chaperone function
VVLVVAPGVVLIGLCWLAIHWLFRRAGTGGAILALGARAPRPGDLEEQQLVNIVQEMAIAAGIPSPRVLLLDGDRPNAAGLGRSAEDAAVVVGRRILDELDRDETQAIVGHLVGSIANGDLRIAFATASVFETFGLLLALLDAPVSPAARATLGRLRELARTARDPRTTATTADLVAAMLTEGTSLARLEDVTRAMQRAIEGIRGLGFLNPLRMTRLALFVPYVLASLVARLVLFLTVGVLLGPLIALAWRARRHLADATAVQLTRYPAALARALVWLVDHAAVVRGAEWGAHLFVVGPEVLTDRARIRYEAEMAKIRRLPGVRERYEQGGGAAAALQAARDQADAAAEGGLARRAGIPFGFHPSLRRRLRRLGRMADVGATS